MAGAVDKDYFFLRIVTKGTVLTTFVVLSTQQELNKIQNIVISTGRDIEWVVLSKLLKKALENSLRVEMHVRSPIFQGQHNKKN